ncbi:hypothetical protein ACFL27_16160 [candidate division CSSED10-310 bacterium]|uniref:DUF3592 domain-containing protein n=1 Tax=candidate division CSSED10-310 bacterium TaxID=2855610 RepID=A0ABV6YZV0_UNCC1
MELKMDVQPSARAIIKNDSVAFLMLIGGPIFLAIGIFALVFGFLPDSDVLIGQQVNDTFAVSLCILAGILTVVLFVLLARRVSYFKTILLSGHRAVATIREIDFIKDRGWVVFEYEYQGHSYQTRATIMKNDLTRNISMGDELAIAINPDNPSQALLVILYCSQNQENKVRRLPIT